MECRTTHRRSSAQVSFEDQRSKLGAWACGVVCINLEDNVGKDYCVHCAMLWVRRVLMETKKSMESEGRCKIAFVAGAFGLQWQRCHMQRAVELAELPPHVQISMDGCEIQFILTSDKVLSPVPQVAIALSVARRRKADPQPQEEPSSKRRKVCVLASGSIFAPVSWCVYLRLLAHLNASRRVLVSIWVPA